MPPELRLGEVTVMVFVGMVATMVMPIVEVRLPEAAQDAGLLLMVQWTTTIPTTILPRLFLHHHA